MDRTFRKFVVSVATTAMLLTACQANSSQSETYPDMTAYSASVVQESVISASSQVSSGTTTAEGKLKIYASTDPLYDFAREIGGDRVEVTDLMPGLTDAHHWEPTPQVIAALNESDLLLINGANFELWLDGAKDSLGKNLQIADMSKDVDLIRAEGVDSDHHDHDHDADHHDHDNDHHDHDHEHPHGHFHGGIDPHYWLSPKQAKEAAEQVRDTFIEKDPAGKDYYKANYDALEKKLDALEKEYDNKLDPYKGRTILVPHEAFAYLCRDYDLKQIGIEGVLADGEPNAARVKEIVDLAKKEGIQVVFSEAGEDDKLPQQIAKEIGATVKPLSTIESVTEEQRKAGDDYISIMQKNLDAILSSFGAAQ